MTVAWSPSWERPLASFRNTGASDMSSGGPLTTFGREERGRTV
jgi:hypothetical protein